MSMTLISDLSYPKSMPNAVIVEDDNKKAATNCGNCGCQSGPMHKLLTALFIFMFLIIFIWIVIYSLSPTWATGPMGKIDLTNVLLTATGISLLIIVLGALILLVFSRL